MAFSSGGDSGHDKVNATINIVPLVDVMLVLLIIFMVTAPLMAHKVEVKLPEANLDDRPDTAPPAPPLTIAITRNGALYLNDQPVSRDLLDSELAIQAQQEPQPPVNIRGDADTPYRIVSDVVQLAQDRGMRKVGFVASREQR